MAVTLNAKGTSVPYFKIGKSGVTLYQGNEDPINDGYTIKTNDIWFDTQAKNLKFRQEDSSWSEMSQVDNMSELHDVDLTGLADGYVLRYSSTSGNWEPFEVTGGLASDWGYITSDPISYDGYTGDVWQLETQTNTLSHTGSVDINGTLTSGPITSPTITDITTQLANLTTEDITEQTNLYHTEARVRAAISVSGGSLSYDNTTGIISYTDTDSSYATKVGYNLADETDTASIVLNPGDAVTPATYRGDVVDNNGNIIVDVSSASATFSGGLMGNIYGDVYDISGANKVLESGTNNLDSSLTVDTANATTLNSGTTNISGNAVFTGSSADFTGTATIGNWNGAVYDRTGQTLIIDDTASPKPIVYANIQGDVVGDVQGNVVGNVDGNVTGDLDGYIRDTNGNVLLNNEHGNAGFGGNISSSGASSFSGSVDFSGATISGFNGSTTGTHTGNVTGNVTGNIEGNIINSQGQVVIDNSGALYPTVIQLPKGITADRPSPATAGMMFFNESTMKFEGYDGTNWIVFSPEDWGTLGGITYNYDFSNISYVNTLTFNLADTSNGASIQPRGAFIHPEGTYYFWTDPSTDKLYRSEMSTAYDITTVSGTPQTLDVSTKEGAASDVFFDDSGTKLYITGSISDNVHQYDLSTAYDLTTASFNQSITTKPSGFNESVPWSLYFKPDGTKMYIVGTNTDSVGEWDLSSAWDISTATFSQSFLLSNQSTTPDAFTMSADGTKMYHGDGYNGMIYRYSLSSAWDVSTASYDGATDLRTVPNAPSVNTYGICFDTAGDRLYITDYADKVHQFSLE